MSTPSDPRPITDRRLIHLSPEDNVCAAAAPLAPGEVVWFRGQPIRVVDHIPTGHKMAVVPIAAGQQVRKYGAPIGTATQDIQPGQYVHTHNLRSDYLPTYTRGQAAPV